MLSYFFLILGAVIMVFPFFWMILSSLKTAAEVNTSPPTFWPNSPTWENYLYAFQEAPFGRYFLNSIVVTLVRVC